MLPNESEALDRIQRDFEDEFADARRLLNVGVRAPTHSEGIKQPQRVRAVSQLLFVACCRLFRSVIAVAELGDDVAVEILTRSMFEAFLAMLFVLRPRVSLWKRQQVHGGVWVKKAVNRHGRRLTPEFRANLYLAHMEFQQHKWASEFATIRGIKRSAAGLRKRLGTKEIAYWKGEIGPGWTDTLLKTGTYSGLRIGELAKCLHSRVGKWYRTIYSLQSSILHSTRIDRFVGMDMKGQPATAWQAGTDQLREPFHVAASMYYTCILVMHEHFDFGPAVATPLAHFESLYNRRRQH